MAGTEDQRGANLRGIAIIGIACRFPGANDWREFWENLTAGVDSIRHFSQAEMLRAGVPEKILKRRDYVKAAPVIDGYDRFDARFFEYSPREARLMDPQQRILLEEAWHALEDAGVDPNRAPDARIGAYMGGGGVVTSYLLAHRSLHASATGGIEHLGNDKDFLSTKLSYKLNLTGPSINVQTACSTSMVAVHLACQAILDGDCEMALAGASTVRVPQVQGYLHRPGDIMSPDGICRAYDAEAQGTVFGSGCGVVVLKHVEDAVADGDHIYAVIRSTALNNDGAEKTSYTASSTPGQARAMAEAFAAAEVDPSTIGLIEGHGTGTVVGDPLEVEALQRCFATDPETAVGGCWLGSVKTNIGHLEQAAGVASLIKTALALHHRQIPPSLNFKRPNPRIDLKTGCFRIATSLAEWPAGPTPRRAAVNSLGLGGTNAFAILEEAPESAERQATPSPVHVLTLSARSPQALADLTDRWRGHLAGLDAAATADACATAAARPAHRHRLAVAGPDAGALARALIDATPVEASAERKLAFVFPGQGAQYPGMARAFYDADAAFRDAFDGVAEPLKQGGGPDIADAVFGPPDMEKLAFTGVQQPALFAIEWALAQMLNSWGVTPQAVLGHSVGAFAAMAVAGIYDAADAAALIAKRATLMGALPEGGAMAAVFAGAEEVEALCRQTDGAVVAALNSPDNTVVSGPATAVDGLVVAAEAKGLAARRLTVSHAFHSPLMTAATAPLAEFADGLTPGEARLPFVSDLTGVVLTGAPNGQYFADHILSPVRFADGLKTLAELGCTDILEVGPGGALRGFTLAALAGRAATYGLIDRDGTDWEVALTTLGNLWARGVDIDPLAFYRNRGARRVPAPLYPFERSRFWLDDEPAAEAADGAPLHGREVRVPGGQRHFQAPLSVARHPWLTDHRVYGEVTLPVAAGLIAFADTRGETGMAGAEIHDLTYHQACVLGEGEERLIDIASPDQGAVGELALNSVASARNSLWQPHITASARPQGEPPAAADIAALALVCPDPIDIDRFYAGIGHLGLNYGSAFRNIRQLSVGTGQALARVRLGAEVTDAEAALHPALVDACLHVFPAVSGIYGDFSNLSDNEQITFLPTMVERFSIHAAGAEEVWSHATLRPGEDPAEGRFTLDIRIYAPDGAPVAVIEGLSVKRLTRAEVTRRERAPVEDWLYAMEWEERPVLPEPAREDTGHWIIVAERVESVAPLAEALTEAGATVEVVTADNLLAGNITVTPPAGVRGLVLATALDTPALMLLDAPALAALSERQFRLTQAALRLVTDDCPKDWGQPRLWIVTRGAQAPRGDRLGGEAAQATLWGHGRVIALEHTNTWGGLIDLDYGDSAGPAVRELLSPDGEDQIALRDARRYAPRLDRRGLDNPDLEVTPPIRADRSYLITGGLGSLGLKLAHWLVARQGARHLVLVSRRPPGEAQQAAIAAIEALGATVKIHSADIADQAQVDRLVAQTGTEGPPLAGVFHCAGLLNDGIMARMHWDQYHRVTASKIEGAWALHKATEALALDHFVLFSSILSLIGSMGQLNYVAGNAFQDALIAHRRRLDLPATAMNWGPWEDAGLATESGERGRAIWRARGTSFIPAEAGIEILHHALSHGFDHLGVTITDWSKFTAQFPQVPRLYARLSDGRAAARPAAAIDRDKVMATVKAATPADRPALVAATLSQVCRAALELDGPPDPEVSLREVGLDSLMSITVINEIEGIFGVRLPARALLQGPSVSELSLMVLDALPDLGTDARTQTDAAAPANDAVRPAPRPVLSGASGKWLVTRAPRKGAQARLFCFPFAGGGSAAFDAWGAAFDPRIEVVAIEPPGRLARIDETPVRTVEDFARGLVPQLVEKLDRPYAVLGHCLGGLTLYETLRFLQARRRPMPVHIFVSGARPPSALNAPGEFEAELEARLKEFAEYRPGQPIHRQSEAVFAEIVRAFDIADSARMLEDADLRALVLPTVRAEFAMASNYSYVPEDPFPVPITCFRGERDAYMRPVDARLWRKLTARKFEICTRDAGHFAIVEDFDFIRAKIEGILLQDCARSA